MSHREQVETHRHDRTEMSRRSLLRTVGATGTGLALGGGGLGRFGTGQVRAAETVIEDFNRSSPLDDYNGSTTSADYEIVQDAMEEGTANSTNTLKATGDYGVLGHTSVSTPRGNEYRVRIKVGDSTTGPSLLTCVQDTTAALDGCYWAYVDQKNGKLDLNLRENGTHTDLTADTSMPALSQGTIYELAVELDSDTVRAILYEHDGTTVVADTGSVSDSTFSSGQLGFYTGGGGYPAYYDYVTKESLDGGSGGGGSGGGELSIPGGGCVVDTFDDGDLDEYSFVTSNTQANTITSPTRSGSHALELRGTSLGLHSYNGLSHYPSRGSTFGCWFRIDDANGSFEFRYGVQNDTDYYFISIDSESNYVTIMRSEGSGLGWITSGEKIPSGIPTDEWLKLRISWMPGSEGPIHSIAILDSTGTQLCSQSGTDTLEGEGSFSKPWTSGGIGYGTGGISDSTFTVQIDSVTIEEWDDTGAGIVIDDFEAATKDDYIFDSGKSGASFVSSLTFSGSKALKISGTNTEMYKITGLPNEPQAGDVVSYWVRAENGASHINLNYAVQDDAAQSRYFVRVDFDDDRLKLYKYDSGGVTLLEKQVSGFTLSEDVWYNVQVDWRTNGWHVISLSGGRDTITISGNDTTWSKGGIGYDAYLSSSGGSVYFDHVTKNGYRQPDAGTVVDDFDDGNLSEYTILTGSASTATSPTYFGSYSLKIDGTDTEMISTTGLPSYPTAGDRFRYRLRVANGASQVNLSYGVQSHDTCYLVQIDFGSNSLALIHMDNGTKTTLAESNSGFTLSEDAWFRIEIDWCDNGDHTVCLHTDSEDRLVQISGSDSSIASGGIGYDAYLSGGGTIYIDHILKDGFRKDIQALESQYGELEDVTTEILSNDSDGNQRTKQTYEFADGTTRACTCTYHSMNEVRSDNGTNRYWNRLTPEHQKQHDRMLNGVKEEMQLGGF